MAQLSPPPSDPAAKPPQRRPGSVRRTSTMLMFWPDGLGTDLHLKGRARDLVTPRSGEPEVVSHADLYAVTGRPRDIQQIAADPAAEGLERLVGRHAGGGLRSAIAEDLPGEVAGGTPLHLLLDDLAGSTLISGFVFVRWMDQIPEMRERLTKVPGRSMVDICSGFRAGSSALASDGSIVHRQNTARPGPLVDPADPVGLARAGRPPAAVDAARPSHRRVGRRRRAGDRRHVPRQLLGARRRGDRRPRIPDARAGGPGTGVLRSVTAVPRVLPYAECPGAAPNASWMAGTELRALRTEVLSG